MESYKQNVLIEKNSKRHTTLDVKYTDKYNNFISE